MAGRNEIRTLCRRIKDSPLRHAASAAAFSALCFLFPLQSAPAAEEPSPAERYERTLEQIRSLLREACGKAGVPFERLGYTSKDLSVQRDEFRLETFDALISDPMIFKITCDSWGAGLRNSVRDPVSAFDALARANEAGFFNLGASDEPNPADPLSFCIEQDRRMHGIAGRDFSPEMEGTAREAFSGLPSDFRAALGRCLEAMVRSAVIMKAALSAAGIEKAEPFIYRRETDWYDEKEGTFRQPLYEFCRALDMNSVLFAGRTAVRGATKFYAFLKEKYSSPEAQAQVRPFRLETPLGRIVVAGPGKDAHEKGRYFLLVDLGGDDSYGSGAGGADFGQYASLCADLGGADAYAAAKDDPPSFGAGVCGIGMLFDVSGNDAYEAHSEAQGHAYYGTGILMDEAGDDRYTVTSGGQGFAGFGAAALLDASGNDVYTCFHLSQGAGATRGVGALVDGSGNDVYAARDDEIVLPSAQSAQHNSSLSQGCGVGRRADMADGHSVSGGIGILVDASGDDKYSGGVMAQAHGYWYGTGVLIDYEGNDEYKAAWYGQSTSAHFGLSYMRDAKGDDKYVSLISQNLGNGRDFSVSVFEDDEGNDSYTVVDRGAGCGNVNGVGLFLDLAGDDAYEIRSRESMGIAILEAAQSFFRRETPTIGLFVDAAGKDSYTCSKAEFALPDMTNGSAWVRTKNRYEFSAGWDRE